MFPGVSTHIKVHFVSNLMENEKNFTAYGVHLNFSVGANSIHPLLISFCKMTKKLKWQVHLRILHPENGCVTDGFALNSHILFHVLQS